MKTKLDITNFTKIEEAYPPIKYRPGADSPGYLAAIKAKEEREAADKLHKQRLNASAELAELQSTIKHFERFKEAFQRSGHEIPHREGTMTLAADSDIVKAIYHIEADLRKEYEQLKFNHIQNNLVIPNPLEQMDQLEEPPI